MAQKQILQVPGITEGLVAYNVPISAAVKANGFVFVSGMPPMDVATGKIVTVGSWPLGFDIEMECVALE